MQIEVGTKMENGRQVYEKVRISALILLSGPDYMTFRENIFLPDEHIRETGFAEPGADSTLQGALVISNESGDGILIFDNTRADGYCHFPGAKEYVENIMERTARTITKGCISQKKATASLPYQLFRIYSDISLTATNGVGPLLADAFRRQPEVFEVKLDNELHRLVLTLNPQCVAPTPDDKDYGRLICLIWELQAAGEWKQSEGMFMESYFERLKSRNAYLEKLLATWDEGLNPLAIKAVRVHSDQVSQLLKRADNLIERASSARPVNDAPIRDDLMPYFIGQPVLLESNGAYRWGIIEAANHAGEVFEASCGGTSLLSSSYGADWFAWHHYSEPAQQRLHELTFTGEEFRNKMRKTELGVLAEFLGATHSLLDRSELANAIDEVYAQMPEKILQRFWLHMCALELETAARK